jgi:hypothetical protein
MVHVREDTYVSNVLQLTLQSSQPLHRTLHRVRVVPSARVGTAHWRRYFERIHLLSTKAREEIVNYSKCKNRARIGASGEFRLGFEVQELAARQLAALNRSSRCRDA